jgi:antitoxin component of MazEF toxin-antitoxin module
MQVTFRKRGNAVAMVMPKAILAETGWEVGTLLELRVEAGQIYIKPAEPPASETVE